MRRFLYRLLRLANDARAIRRGRFGRRLVRRAYGRATGKAADRYVSKFNDPGEPRFTIEGQGTMKVLLAVVLVAALGAACASEGDASDVATQRTTTTHERTTTTEQRTAIERAVDKVDPEVAEFFTVMDDGHSLAIDGESQNAALIDHDRYPAIPRQGADIGNTVMVLVLLDVPEAIGTLMDQTRALDGRQFYDWSGDEGSFTASWTYHPDSGLDMLIEEA